MLLPALGGRSWAGELGSSQPIPIPFLSASLTLIKLPTIRVAPPLLGKVLCSQHVHHMCLQHPRLNIYTPILCQQSAYATRTPALAGAGDWPLGTPTSPLVAGGGWGWASDLYLIYFIGLFRARRLPLSACACSTFIGLGGKNKEYVYIYVYLYLVRCGGSINGGRRISCTVLQRGKTSQQLARLCLRYKAVGICSFVAIASCPSLWNSQTLPRCWISPCWSGLVCGQENSLLPWSLGNAIPKSVHGQRKLGSVLVCSRSGDWEVAVRSRCVAGHLPGTWKCNLFCSCLESRTTALHPPSWEGGLHTQLGQGRRGGAFADNLFHFFLLFPPSKKKKKKNHRDWELLPLHWDALYLFRDSVSHPPFLNVYTSSQGEICNSSVIYVRDLKKKCHVSGKKEGH